MTNDTYDFKEIDSIKTRLTNLEYELKSIKSEIEDIRVVIGKETAVTKHLSDSLIRFEVSVNKINELSQNYYSLLTEMQDIKINRSVDAMVLKAVKFVSGGAVLIILGIIVAFIFTGTPSLK